MAKEIEKVFVKPIPGGRVRDPITLKPLDKDGELKPLTTFWRRRLRMKDVELTVKAQKPKVIIPLVEPKQPKKKSTKREDEVF